MFQMKFPTEIFVEREISLWIVEESFEDSHKNLEIFLPNFRMTHKSLLRKSAKFVHHFRFPPCCLWATKLEKIWQGPTYRIAVSSVSTPLRAKNSAIFLFVPWNEEFFKWRSRASTRFLCCFGILRKQRLSRSTKNCNIIFRVPLNWWISLVTNSSSSTWLRLKFSLLIWFSEKGFALKGWEKWRTPVRI